jgi:hypothetical protein
MKEDLAREIVVAYAQGWSIDKIAKTLKLSPADVSKVSDKLEDERLAGRRDEYETLPYLPVIRERDFNLMKDPLRRHTQEFTKVLVDNWKDIESMVDSLDGAKSIPRGRVMYETVVSGILLGGLMDAFYEDKTLMPPPSPARQNRPIDRAIFCLACGKQSRSCRKVAAGVARVRRISRRYDRNSAAG